MKIKLKELLELATKNGSNHDSSSLFEHVIGKYCIVRSRNEGINFGKVLVADDTGCVISDARRIYYHKPLDSSLSWYEGVAESGLHSDSKISGSVSKKVIVEDYSLTICSKTAIQNIKSYAATKS